MARPGPAAKPAELKMLEGNRGHRPLDITSTFRPEVGLPTIPKGLSAGARKVWKRLAPELVKYNLMSAVYSDTFEDLCESISDVKELRHSIRARQALLRSQGKDPAEAFEASTPGGMPVQHPRYQILKSERQMMHSLIAKFGLTPSEQASVTTAIRAQLRLAFEGGEGGSPPAPRDGPPQGFAEFQ
jgi:P27 family predicted phage terminase small subunit